jgi:hypothetical protein
MRHEETMIPTKTAINRVKAIRDAVAGQRTQGQKKVCVDLCDQILSELEAYGSDYATQRALGMMNTPSFFGGTLEVEELPQEPPNKAPWWKLWGRQ